MKTQFPDLPGWTFEVEEVSFGMYEVCCRYGSGGVIRKSGTDPEALLAECRMEAQAALDLARQKRRA